MKPVIDYFYAPISGFAYLGEPRLREIAERWGAVIRYRPVDIARVFAASETTPPFAQSDARLSYRLEDLARWGKYLGLPINPKPAHWPAPVDLACRAIAATDLLGLCAGQASFAMLKAVWVEEQNIGEPEAVRAALDAAHLDASRILTEAESPAARARVEADTEAAIAARVFGSPTYVVEGERFWGQDRLDFVEAALARRVAEGAPALPAREGARCS